jgi:hypothetical protein
MVIVIVIGRWRHVIDNIVVAVEQCLRTRACGVRMVAFDVYNALGAFCVLEQFIDAQEISALAALDLSIRNGTPVIHGCTGVVGGEVKPWLLLWVLDWRHWCQGRGEGDGTLLLGGHPFISGRGL